MKLGSKGPQVVELQHLLNKNGFNLVEDGDFGPGTDIAVRNFQSSNGLKVDGIVGPFTLSKLKSLAEVNEGKVVALTIAGVKVWLEDEVYSWTAGMAIDADGGYRTYAPLPLKGLDYLANAGGPGNWYGIVTRNGVPVVQGPNDPFPGFYISATTYQWPQFGKYDPKRYVDSETVPFIVVPPGVRKHPVDKVLGCRATVTYKGKTIEAVVADTGPAKKIGEASMACAKALGIPSSPKNGGREVKDVLYKIWPGIPAKINGVIYTLQ